MASNNVASETPSGEIFPKAEPEAGDLQVLENISGSLTSFGDPSVASIQSLDQPAMEGAGPTPGHENNQPRISSELGATQNLLGQPPMQLKPTESSVPIQVNISRLDTVAKGWLR